jgi:hypothetical protein
MKLIRYLILLALIGSVVVAFGMVTQGWKVGGVTWPELRERFLPTKKAFERRQEKLFKQAEREAETDK